VRASTVVSWQTSRSPLSLLDGKSVPFLVGTDPLLALFPKGLTAMMLLPPLIDAGRLELLVALMLCLPTTGAATEEALTRLFLTLNIPFPLVSSML